MGSKGYPLDSRGLPIPDGSWPPGREAPARLEAVRRFCNSQNLEAGADLLRTPAELDAWLVQEGYPSQGRVTRRDLQRVLRLREAVRGLIGADRDGTRRTAEVALDAVLEGLPVVLRIAAEPRIRSARPGVDVLLAGIAEAVFVAQLDGTWRRLRACGHCGWVVYDHSKNGSAVWCSPLACGSRVKARAWRARNRTVRDGGG